LPGTPGFDVVNIGQRRRSGWLFSFDRLGGRLRFFIWLGLDNRDNFNINHLNRRFISF
jgi:hypothetical protein